jgi:apolipoprotein N-acyltransferase
LSTVDQLVKFAPSIRLKVVQGNIKQSIKWNPEFQISTIDKHLRLSQSTGNQNPDLIIWPETALPFYFQHNVPLTKRVSQGIQEIGTYFITGSPSFTRGSHRVDYYNSAYLIGPDGRPLEKYDKTHLVPFGEYVPLKRWLPFVGKLVEQVGDFARGDVGDTIAWKNNKLGILICYELIFPYISRAMARNGASMLINITNDAWYGRSSAPYQHFSMAVFRAIENRRALVRSANTGISGFIDPAGRILTATPLFKEAAVTQSVPVMARLTFYTRFGDVFAKICLAIVVMVFLCQEARKRKTKKR